MRPNPCRPRLEPLEDRLAPAVLPSGFTETLVAGGLDVPAAMELAPDGRVFVAEQTGRLRVIKNGALLPTPFVSLSVNAAGERGLLGIAFDPNFASNSFVYVYYTLAAEPVHNRVSRFTAAGDVAAPGSEVVLLELPALSAGANHNGGALHFGTDGKLYVGVGDNANPANSQALTTPFGKMLRLNADGTIPADNPFFATATGTNRAIWALGLRNPFTFAVQPGTGKIYINDVGGLLFEEINEGVAGANYGWPATEGVANNPQYRDPLHAYPHGPGNASGQAITGGTFYNPPTAPFPGDYAGDYFFADFVNGWIRRYDAASRATELFASDLPFGPVDLKVTAAGSLLYLTRGTGSATGTLYRVDYPAGQAAPALTRQPTHQTVLPGQAVTFQVEATGTPNLAYQWLRNGSPLPGATGPSYTLAAPTLADSGAAFRVTVANAFGTASSSPALLTVTANRPPVPVITAPAADAAFTAGETVAFAGSGTDPEDGTLSPQSLSWKVDYVRGNDVAPFVPPLSGILSGSFTIPTRSNLDPAGFYRLSLTATDSGGRSESVTRDLLPRTAQVALAASTPGLRLTLEGQPVTTPFTFTSVIGSIRSVAAVSPQALNGRAYEFVSWSNGQPQAHEFSTLGVPVTYTASFREVGQVEFAAETYRVEESAAEATVTVTRRGALDRAATVEYALTRGTAVDGQDYVGTPGTLTFAPNETSKSFAVPILQDQLIEGRETIRLTLRNARDGVVFGARTTAILSVRDEDGTANQRFVAQVYQDVLERLVELEALTVWGNQLTAGRLTRPQFVQAILTSYEYRFRQVQALYARYLRRPGELAGVNSFVDLLQRGVTPDSLVPLFTGSLEYYISRGGRTDSGFLDALYEDTLERPADAAGKSGFAALLANGTSAVQLAGLFVNSLEYRQNQVTRHYLRLLTRAPDPAGLAAFADFLAPGRRDTDLAALLLTSAEYFAQV